MWKIFKSRKALSPVVAAIILIAVTVAVSIAVAAWMGALTFTFMKTEELSITDSSWGGLSAGSYANATLTMKNTGTGALTIDSVKVNSAGSVLSKYREVGQTAWTNWPTTGGLTIDPGKSYQLVVTQSFTQGNKYEFAFHTASGKTYPYTVTAGL